MTEYTGTCQACGRRQAIHVHTGLIAKHGYTTDYGFFNGTCGGSDKQPLELDTALNVSTVDALCAFADKQEALAAGEITHVAVSVRTDRFDARGRRVVEQKQVDRAEFEASQPRWESFDRAVEAKRRALRRHADLARIQAHDLVELRNKVHGQPLQERPVEAPIQRETFKTYREAYARVEELKAAGRKAQSRKTRFVGYTVTYR